MYGIVTHIYRRNPPNVGKFRICCASFGILLVNMLGFPPWSHGRLGSHHGFLNFRLGIKTRCLVSLHNTNEKQKIQLASTKTSLKKNNKKHVINKFNLDKPTNEPILGAQKNNKNLKPRNTRRTEMHFPVISTWPPQNPKCQELTGLKKVEIDTLYTPSKMNMEHKNGCLKDDVSFQRVH